MVIVCSAIIHIDLTTTVISNQYRDALYGLARSVNNMQRGNAERQFKRCIPRRENHRNTRFSEMVNI